MDICVEEVSYIHLGWFSVYIVFCDTTVCTIFNKFDKEFKKIKKNPDFIRINNSTVVNYHNIDRMDHSRICVCGGNVFRLGFYYRKRAVDKYMDKLIEMECKK